MSQVTKIEQKALPVAWEKVLVQGELQHLTPDQRASYYLKVCESLGLNHLTSPFAYLTLNGRLVFYAKKDATDQLRKIQNVSLTIVSREMLDGVYVVTARATMPTGRTDEAIGAIFLGSAKGNDLANAMMKAETKAKRRVTLSICGLGFLDETEVEDAHHAPPAAPKIEPKWLPGIEPRSTAETFVTNLLRVPRGDEIIRAQIAKYVAPHPEAAVALAEELAKQMPPAKDSLVEAAAIEEGAKIPDDELFPFEKKGKHER